MYYINKIGLSPTLARYNSIKICSQGLEFSDGSTPTYLILSQKYMQIVTQDQAAACWTDDQTQLWFHNIQDLQNPHSVSADTNRRIPQWVEVKGPVPTKLGPVLYSGHVISQSGIVAQKNKNSAEPSSTTQASGLASIHAVFPNSPLNGH